MNPHNLLVAIDPPLPAAAPESVARRRRWRCKYCAAVGTYAELRSRPCSYVYPPCEACGQTPECALDCPAVWAALEGPGVAVTGALTKGPKS